MCNVQLFVSNLNGLECCRVKLCSCNRADRGHEKTTRKINILKTVRYRVYKCTAVLHVPIGRAHRENSTTKLDNDAKRVANISNVL